MKICFRCTKQLPSKNFNKDSKKPDGLAVTCKDCKKLSKSDFCSCGNIKYKIADKCSACHLNRYADLHAEQIKNEIKPCYKCKKNLPFSEFSLSKSEPTGRQHTCKACQKSLRKLHTCTDCGKYGIDAKALRCEPCHYKFRSGANSPNWKGGRTLNANGYVMLAGYQGHPNAGPGGQIREHVLVMANHLGRPLIKSENVHHINGERDDNRIENLELWSTSQPAGQRVADKVAWAKELLRLYDPGVLNDC